MNTLVFHNWSVNCFPCLRSILFALSWSMFRTCFHPEESLYLNKFCSLPTADVEANVIVVRMFFFFSICLPLPFKLYFFFLILQAFTLYLFVLGRQMTTTLTEFCFHTALWICIIIFVFLLYTLWIVQAFPYIRGQIPILDDLTSCQTQGYFAMWLHLGEENEYQWLWACLKIM